MDARYAFIGAIVGLLAVGLAIFGAPLVVIATSGLVWAALLWIPTHAVGGFTDDALKS